MGSHIPPQVLKDLEEADALIAASQSGAETPTPEPEPAPDPEPVVEPTTEEPAAVVPAATDDSVAIKAELETLRHKYDVLQGKYNAEIDALRQQRVQPVATPVPAPIAPVPTTDLSKLSDAEFQKANGLTDEDMEMGRKFWERSIAVSERAAKRAQQEVIETTVKPLQQQLAQTANEKFLGKITDAVKDWEAINESPDFHLWLTDHPGTQDLLDLARSSNEPSKAITVFQMYKKDKTPSETKPLPLPSIASQVTPPKSGAPASSVASEKTLEAEYKSLSAELEEAIKRQISPAQRIDLEKKLDDLIRRMSAAKAA